MEINGESYFWLTEREQWDLREKESEKTKESESVKKIFPDTDRDV